MGKQLGKMETITHEIGTVLVELPIEPRLPEDGYISRMLHVTRLMPRQAAALKMLALGADKKGITTKNGRRVTNGHDVVRNFLDKVADEVGIN